MTQSVLIFNLLPGRRDEFVDTFRRLEVLATSSFQAGFRGAQLYVDVGDPDIAMVTAQWDSPEAYQGWLDNPAREGLGDELHPLLVDEPQGRVVELVQDVAPNTPVSGA